jgi:Tfp pilus tip-associated adhesin PilY1
VQPLPVTENADGDLLPDRSRLCTGAEDTACLAWNAAAELLEQAPDTDEVLVDRRIGTGVAERRVTYTKAAAGNAVPREIRAFDYTTSDPVADERDLWQGMAVDFVAGDSSSEQAARLLARDVIRRTLATRSAVVDDAETGAPQTIAFVLGDVFHADPVLLGGPSNFRYLANDLEGNGRSCTDTTRPNEGYRCFFERERRRRKVLLAPSNDGQIHAFDAGFFRGSVESGRLKGRFDLGTGRELFAHIPRPMLAHTRRMTAAAHAAGIDGPLTVGDAFIDPVHDGDPTASEREWRTVAIGGYRDGGSGLYALDVTHPDPVQSRKVTDVFGQAAVEFVPVAASSAVPACNALTRSLPSGCARPYPMALWEFSDPDLGASWSKVTLGRVLVRSSGNGTPMAKFVAVFGGGLDATGSGRGQFLYMVDVETGRTLWKRPVVGAVPSEPAVVDTDLNGVLDTLYVGTTAGYVYKVDLSLPADLDPASGRVESAGQWRPFRVFDTGGRAIFFRPSVIFDESSGRYAIGFGTGDRSDLWGAPSPGQVGGRFYMIVDPGWSEGAGTLPTDLLDESSFRQIDARGGFTGVNLLSDAATGDQRGWVLRLGDDERVVSDAFAVSGVLTFATFDPDRPEHCSFGGHGRVYSLNATNADPLSGAQGERALAIEGLAGAATVTSAGFSVEGAGQAVDPFASAELQGIRDTLRDLFPADCRFGSFVLDVSATSANRELLALAQIPVCIARRNWTEHF